MRAAALLDELRPAASHPPLRPAAVRRRGHRRTGTRSARRRGWRASCAQACHARTAGNPFLLDSSWATALRGAERGPARAGRGARAGAGRACGSPARRPAARAAPRHLLGRSRCWAARLRFATPLRSPARTSKRRCASPTRCARPRARAGDHARVCPSDRSLGDLRAIDPGERALGHARAARLLDQDGAAPERVALHILHTEPAGNAWAVAGCERRPRRRAGEEHPAPRPPIFAARSRATRPGHAARGAARARTRAGRRPPSRRAADVLREAVELTTDPGEHATERRSAPARSDSGATTTASSRSAARRSPARERSNRRRSDSLEAELTASAWVSPATVAEAAPAHRRSARSTGIVQRLAHQRRVRGHRRRPAGARGDAAARPGPRGRLGGGGARLTDRGLPSAGACLQRRAGRRPRGVRRGPRCRSHARLDEHGRPRQLHPLDDRSSHWPARGRRQPMVASRWTSSSRPRRRRRSPGPPHSSIEALTGLGRLDEADAIAAARPREREPPHGYIHTLVFLQARGALRVAQERSADALRDLLKPARAGTSSARSTGARYVAHRCRRRACCCARPPEEAAALAGEQLTLARRVGTPSHGRDRAAGARQGDRGGRAEELLAQAISLLEAAPARHELALALTDLGALLRRAGRRTEAGPRCAAPSISRSAPAPRRSRTGPGRSCSRPEPGPGARR